MTNQRTPLDLNDKVAVITGAAGGIGFGMARAAVARGMKVMIADLDGARASEAAGRLSKDGAVAIGTSCDVRNPAEVDALRDAALEELGSIDLVCNNAGVGLARPVVDCNEADWKLVVDINLLGVINGVRTFLPHLIEQGSGHLNATASLSGLVGDPDLAIYSATKFGVVGMMEAIAQEMRRDHPGVSASVLCPGPVATDLMASSDKVLANAGSTGNDELNQAAGEYLAKGLHPDAVGQLALDGISEGRFWLISHPDLTFSLLDERYEAMKRGDLASPDEEWVNQ